VAKKGWLLGSEGDRWEMDAELRIGAMGFDEGYVSLVEMELGRWVKVRFFLFSFPSSLFAHPTFLLQATAKDASMFRHLSTLWSFTPISPPTPTAHPQTKVDLNLAYQFTSPLHAAAMSAVWDKVSALMVQKFEERVQKVHGRR
jgi:coenzyme Q-binding protein COQ10